MGLFIISFILTIVFISACMCWIKTIVKKIKTSLPFKEGSHNKVNRDEEDDEEENSIRNFKNILRAQKQLAFEGEEGLVNNKNIHHYGFENNNKPPPSSSTKIAICGCVKNAEKWLHKVFKNIIELKINLMTCHNKKFLISDVFVAYDKSDDKSFETLKEISNDLSSSCGGGVGLNFNIFSNENQEYYKTVSVSGLGLNKTVNIANARNLVLKKIFEVEDKNEKNVFDYLIWIDFDDVCSVEYKDINLIYKAIEDLENNHFDCATFNNKNYYDYWALAVNDYNYSWLHWNNNIKILKNMQKELYSEINKNNCSKIKKDYIEVQSAFGGFAIYNFKKIKQLRDEESLFFYDPTVYDENISSIEKVKNEVGVEPIFHLEEDVKTHDYKYDCEHKKFNIKNNLKVVIYKQCLFKTYKGEHYKTYKPYLYENKSYITNASSSLGKKVAICFWGLCRATPYTYESIIENIYDSLSSQEYEYKVFLHTNSFGNEKYSNGWSGDRDVSNIDENWKRFRPNKWIVEPESKYKEIIDFEKYKTKEDYYQSKYRETENIIKAMYSLKSVTTLLEEENECENFDYVIFCRPDLKIMEKINFLKIFENVNSSTVITPETNCYPVNDRFAVLNYQNALIYGKRFDKILNYSKQLVFHPETFLYVYLKSKGINFKTTRKIKAHIVRSSGNFENGHDKLGINKLSIRTTLNNHWSNGFDVEKDGLLLAVKYKDLFNDSVVDEKEEEKKEEIKTA